MKRSARRRTAVAVLAALLVLFPLAPPPAQAQFAVIDAANLSQNVRTALQTYAAILQRITQILNQIRQIEAAYQELAALADPTLDDIGWFLFELQYLMEETEGLVYSLETLDEDLLELFPGAVPAADLPAEQDERTHRTLETLRASLLSTKRMTRNFSLSLGTLETITQQTLSAQGNLQALQGNAAILNFTAQQLMKLLQQMAVTTNAQSVYFSHTLETEAAAEATFTDWMKRGDRPAPAYDASPIHPLVPAGFPW